MTLIERLFALKANPCFQSLDDSELAGIAQVAKLRCYAPGEPLAIAGQLLTRLYVVVAGQVENLQGQPMPPVIGAACLLGGLPLVVPLQASPVEGASCLLIAKGHFFTIVHQCPALVTGLVELPFSEVAPEMAGETGS